MSGDTPSYLTNDPCTTDQTIINKAGAQGFLAGMLRMVGASSLVGGNPISDIASSIQQTNNALTQSVANNTILIATQTQQELQDITQNINEYQKIANATMQLNNEIINNEIGKVDIGLVAIAVLVFVIIICEIISSNL